MIRIVEPRLGSFPAKYRVDFSLPSKRRALGAPRAVELGSFTYSFGAGQ
jgi:hypothetical protein